MVQKNVREIPQSAFGNCPFFIMVADHYREDFTCKCNDPVYHKTVMQKWGYTKKDFLAHGIK